MPVPLVALNWNMALTAMATAFSTQAKSILHLLNTFAMGKLELQVKQVPKDLRELKDLLARKAHQVSLTFTDSMGPLLKSLAHRRVIRGWEPMQQ